MRANQFNENFVKRFEKFLVGNNSIGNLYHLGQTLDYVDPSSMKSISFIKTF